MLIQRGLVNTNGEQRAALRIPPSAIEAILPAR